MSIYGLADCNNFFVSCERVFRPALEGRPAVVLSSNDGCIVARSDEAKALGVKMAQPAFQAKDLIDRHSIAVISGNLQFYTDMSNRVMQVFGELVPAVEKYSIDECFLDLTGIPQELTALCQDLKRTVCGTPARAMDRTADQHRHRLPGPETHRVAMDRTADQHRHRRDQDPCQDRQPPREDLRQNGRRSRSHR